MDTELERQLEELVRRQDWQAAVRCLEPALERNPEWSTGWFNLGICWIRLRKGAEARRALERGLDLEPGRPRVRLSLADASALDGDLGRAEFWCREECRHFPAAAGSWMALGMALERQGHGGESEPYREAFRLGPENPAVLGNWGRWLQENHQLTEATAVLEEGLRRHPQHGQLQWQFLVNCFLRGDLTGGFQRLDARFAAPNFRRGNALDALPLWDGRSIPDGPILVEPEQGYGDTLQFLRFVPGLVERGCRVWLGLPKALERLVAGSIEVERFVTDPRVCLEAACRIPMMSLPARLGVTASGVDGSPYLSVPGSNRSTPRPPGAPLRVGLVWRGNPDHRNDRRRSIPLGLFQSLMSITGVEWVSLQWSASGMDEFRELQSRGVRIEDGLDGGVDYADTARAITDTDLVLTVDTSVAHLSGALGHPTWVLLPHYPDWRWALTGEDTPWYRNMRLFRQSRRDAWAEPLETVRRALESVLRFRAEGLDPAPALRRAR